MKPSRFFFQIAGLSLLALPCAKAAILIRVDVSNPAAVVLAATTNHSLVSDSSASIREGVSLLGFLSVEFPITFDFFTSSNLVPSGTSSPYDAYIVGFESLTGRDVNLWGTDPFRTTQSFSISAPAFTGSAIANFTGLGLPAVGATGNIIVGDTTIGSGAVIGQWVAVPEPSTTGLLMGAGALALTLRIRRKTC